MATAALSSSPQPRPTALIPLMLVSLLLFSVVAGHAAASRVPAPAEASSRSQEQYGDVVYEEKTPSFAGGDVERCGGGAGGGGEGEEDEECLMRRTLVAHTDYIYTQGGGHN